MYPNLTHHAAGDPSGEPPRCRRARKGGIMVVVAGAMLVLFGAAAWTVDAGVLLQDRTHHQAAADAGALGGAWEIPIQPYDEDAVREAAVQWVQANQRDRALAVTTANVSIWDHPSGSKALTVSWTQPRDTYFARLFPGAESFNVKVAASATVGYPVGKVVGALPFGMPGFMKDGEWQVLVDSAGTTMHPDGVELAGTYRPLSDYTEATGNEFIVKAGSGPNNGNFMALSVNGSGANQYLNNVMYGIENPGLVIGQDYDTEPGNMRGPTDSGGDYRMADPELRDAVLPIIDALDWHNAAGKAKPVTVIGFCGVYLMSCNNGEITAVHKPVSIGGAGNLGTSPTTPGVYVPILIPTP